MNATGNTLEVLNHLVATADTRTPGAKFPVGCSTVLSHKTVCVTSFLSVQLVEVSGRFPSRIMVFGCTVKSPSLNDSRSWLDSTGRRFALLINIVEVTVRGVARHFYDEYYYLTVNAISVVGYNYEYDSIEDRIDEM